MEALTVIWKIESLVKKGSYEKNQYYDCKTIFQRKLIINRFRQYYNF